MLARYMLSSCVHSSVCLSVRLSVRLSVTSRHCTEMAKRRITQTTPYDNRGTLVFWRQRCRRNFDGVTPNGRAPNRGRAGSNRRFSTNISLYLKNGASYGPIYYGTLILVCAVSNGAISSDLEWPITTSNHPIFDILYRLSYLHGEWR